MNVALIDLFYANEEWAKLHRPGAVEFVQKRLSALSKSLGDKPYLDGDRFTAGDLMMTTVLRILKHTDIVTSEKRLAAYVERCTARPASSERSMRRLVILGRLHKPTPGHRRGPAVLAGVLFQTCEHHEARAPGQYISLYRLHRTQPIRVCVRNDRLGSRAVKLSVSICSPNCPR